MSSFFHDLKAFICCVEGDVEVSFDGAQALIQPVQSIRMALIGLA